MTTSALPLVVLGGSDLEPSRLPGGTDLHPLAAYKGAAIELRGRPLVLHVVERFRACGGFEPVLIAGPARVYGGLDASVSVIDTDADLTTNLRAVIETLERRSPGGTMAVVTCDVLPDVDELRLLVHDHAEGGPCALWYPLVRAPREPGALGAFGWKPKYQILPEGADESTAVLPGHLLIARPSALRLGLLYRLLHAAYKTRNRSVETRRRAMVRSALAGLLVQDLLHLVTLRVPDLTWTVLRNGFGLAREVRSGELTQAGLERRVGRILLRARHRRRHPELGVRLPVLDALSLAEDVDTAEEALALGAELDDR